MLTAALVRGNKTSKPGKIDGIMRLEARGNATDCLRLQTTDYKLCVAI